MVSAEKLTEKQQQQTDSNQSTIFKIKSIAIKSTNKLSWNEHPNAKNRTLRTLNVQTSNFLNITFWSKIELRTCQTTQKTE